MGLQPSVTYSFRQTLTSYPQHRFLVRLCTTWWELRLLLEKNLIPGHFMLKSVAQSMMLEQPSYSTLQLTQSPTSSFVSSQSVETLLRTVQHFHSQAVATALLHHHHHHLHSIHPSSSSHPILRSHIARLHLFQ